MRIDSSAMLAGLPVLDVRRFMRYAHAYHEFETPLAAEVLGLTAQRAQRLLRALVEVGYLRPSQEPHADWEITSHGRAFAMASAARPMRRATAERLLTAVLDRARMLADFSAHEYAFNVGRLVVFGSYLREVPMLSDLDLAVEWVPRFVDRHAQIAYQKTRIKLAWRAGRQFRNLSDEMFWPHDEVRRYLKARSGYISIHDWSDEREFIEAVPHRTVYPHALHGETVREGDR